MITCILPVVLSDHVTTLFATTPGPVTSWFMQAIKLRDAQGKPLIPLKRTYEPCDMHAQTDTPWICACNIIKRAEWKNETREDYWAPLWGARRDVFEQERKGVEIHLTTQMFSAQSVEQLRTRPHLPVRSPLRYIYIAIDPAEGGKDEFAIAALTFQDSHWLVSPSLVSPCGLASLRARQIGGVLAAIFLCVCVCMDVFSPMFFCLFPCSRAAGAGCSGFRGRGHANELVVARSRRFGFGCRWFAPRGHRRCRAGCGLGRARASAIVGRA